MKTISLKLAKEINSIAKEKGVELGKSKFMHQIEDKRNLTKPKPITYTEFRAYTTDELLEMLLNKTNENGKELQLNIVVGFSDDGQIVYLVGSKYIKDIVETTPAEALGLLFKELLAKDLIK